MDGELEVMDVGADTGDSRGDDGAADVQEIGADPEVADVSADDSAGSEGDKDPAGQPDAKAAFDKLRAHAAEIKKENPVLGKALERALWKSHNVDKLGSTQEITALKEAVELHGGLEGLTSMAEELQAGRDLEQGFERGDPKVIDGWATDYPEGFKKLIPAALDKLAQMDPTRFEQLGSNLTDQMFEKYGVFSAVQKLGAAIDSGNNAEAVKMFNDLAKFLGDMRGLAARAKENPYKAREEELDKREQTIQDRDKKAFYGGVRSEVNTQVTTSMNQEIAKLMRGKKFSSVEQGNRVRGQITEELKRLINVGDYAKKYETVMGQADKAKSIAFIVSNANRQMGKAVQAILKDFNLLGNGVAPRGITRPAPKAAAGPGQVAGRPHISDVDFTRTDKATFLGARSKGTAWLKSGKQAKW